ncbi:hypothetical protein [Pseudoalteromonas aurantia]|uniref:Immunity protein 35 domain-containing protein n=1 Tax=Pseudoalteromonas aurantia TaxID=43654 RepID=A0ABY2VS51_9GAMM|nr:hypothetical protein [Pseudoalteromonas aurantia]TMO54413.1 hypothetical protein CWC18_20820 [Pseudoalteromonas aurantia]TMO69351.1 hypothetical protein CWC20_20730 [Pseudoalteromonas aurantia]
MSEEAMKIAKSLLESDENYLDNVIAIWRIGNEKYGQCWDTEYHVFGVIESETDHLPLKHVRPNCSANFLIKADEELAETMRYYRTDVTNACHKIISSKNV